MEAISNCQNSNRCSSKQDNFSGDEGNTVVTSAPAATSCKRFVTAESPIAVTKSHSKGNAMSSEMGDPDSSPLILMTLHMPAVVVVACAVSEHCSRAPVESCGVVCCTPQALSLLLESWDSVLCLPLCLCPFLFVYCPPVYIYCSGLGTFPPVSFPPLQVSSFALLPLILVSFPPLQSPWCSVTQGPFESRF